MANSAGARVSARVHVEAAGLSLAAVDFHAGAALAGRVVFATDVDVATVDLDTTGLDIDVSTALDLGVLRLAGAIIVNPEPVGLETILIEFEPLRLDAVLVDFRGWYPRPDLFHLSFDPLLISMTAQAIEANRGCNTPGKLRNNYRKEYCVCF